MYQYEKRTENQLGAQTEDELMKYILQKPVKPGRRFPMNLSWQRNLV